MKTKNFWGRLCPKLPRVYIHTMAAVLLCAALAMPAMAATNTGGNDMWTVAQNIIVDVYNHIAGISTVRGTGSSAFGWPGPSSTASGPSSPTSPRSSPASTP